MFNESIRKALKVRHERYIEVDQLLATPEVLAKPDQIRMLSKERGPLFKLVSRYEEFLKIESEITDCEEMLKDKEMAEMAREELKSLKAQYNEVVPWLENELLQADEDSGRDVIIEIRAGTGGDEAALFCMTLFRMYSRYIENKGWKMDLSVRSESEGGGMKEVAFEVTGDEVYRRLRYESGGHRVQRVPTTESQGRIHTSMVTVAVMPVVEEVEVEIKNEDLQIDTMKATGPGGQSVNTTDSAVRLTHLPTGLVVICMDEKSQIKNRAKALKVLRSRLYKLEQEKQKSEQDEMRRSQIGSGDRSERIRTYNFPQSRVSDHRLSENMHNIDEMMNGELDPIIDKLEIWDRDEKIAALG
jgi:peptide chain release factor 1